MNRLLEALVCLAIAGVLYLIQRNNLKSGTVLMREGIVADRDKYPRLYAVGLAIQWLFIAAALVGAVWLFALAATQ